MNVLSPSARPHDAVGNYHCLVAYDRTTDEIAFEAAIPEGVEAIAFRIAEIAADDPAAAFSYRLNGGQVPALASLLQFANDAVRFEYFLVPGGGNQRAVL